MIVIVVACAIGIGVGIGFSWGYVTKEKEFQDIMTEVGISIITRIEGDKVTHFYMIGKKED